MILDQQMLEQVRALFWCLYLAAIPLGLLGAALHNRRCLAKTVAAWLAASVAQTVIELHQGAPLHWWQHMLIDVPLFWVITLPPRHYWQSTFGALVLAQMLLHACWAMAPAMAREHWLGVILIGIVKCLVVLAWAGGERVENMLGRGSRLVAHLVPAALAGKLAR